MPFASCQRGLHLHDFDSAATLQLHFVSLPDALKIGEGREEDLLLRWEGGQEANHSSAVEACAKIELEEQGLAVVLGRLQVIDGNFAYLSEKQKAPF